MCRIIEENMNDRQPLMSWVGVFESLLRVWVQEGGQLRSVQPAPGQIPCWARWQNGRQWLAVPNGTPTPYVLPREWFERMELLEVGSPRKIEIIDLTPVQETMFQRWIRVACFTENFLRKHDANWFITLPEHGNGCQLGGLEIVYDQLGAAALYVSVYVSVGRAIFFELGDECTEELFHDQNWLREWLFQTDWDFVQA